MVKSKAGGCNDLVITVTTTWDGEKASTDIRHPEDADLVEVVEALEFHVRTIRTNINILKQKILDEAIAQDDNRSEVSNV